MSPLFELRRERAVEDPLERDRLRSVRLEGEADLLKRLDDLVMDRADDGQLRFWRQTPTCPHVRLLDPTRDAGVGVDHVPIRVLAQSEAQLDAAVPGHRHGANLLCPADIVR